MRMTMKTLALATALGGALLWSGAAAADEIVWWTPNWGEARAQKLAADFQAANPQHTVKLVVTVASGLPSRVETALRSGTPPDLIDVSGSWNVPLAATGELMALDEFIASGKVDMADLLPAAVKTAQYEGKQYGLPYRAQALGLLYNKKLFREAGLDPERPPQTWGEMRQAAKQLTRTGGNGNQQYGLGVVGGGEKQNIISRLLPFIWMNGGDILSDDNKIVVDQPAVAEAVAFYASFYTEDKSAPPSTLQNDGLALRRLFGTETIAAYLGGQFDIPAIQKENPALEIGVGLFPHPEGKEHTNLLSGWNFVVPQDAAHPEATLELLAFLMKPDSQGYYTDTFPASQQAMNLPRFQEPLLQPFKESLQHSRSAPSVPVWVNVIDVMYDQTQLVLLGEATPEEAVEEAASEIEARME